MTLYTQSALDDLIQRPKVIISGGRLLRFDYNYKRGDFSLRAADAKSNARDSFKVFMRQNRDLPEEFSVGLVYHSAEGEDLVLLRCNGKQAQHINRVIDKEKFIDQFHIHQATEAALLNNSKPEQWAYAAPYGSFEGAIIHMAEVANVTNARDYWGNYFDRQFSLELVP